MTETRSLFSAQLCLFLLLTSDAFTQFSMNQQDEGIVPQPFFKLHVLIKLRTLLKSRFLLRILELKMSLRPENQYHVRNNRILLLNLDPLKFMILLIA